MMNKIILATLMTLLISENTFAQQQTDLIKGYWAMNPLVNGIANVVYLDGKDQSTLYPFVCNFQTKSVSSPDKPEVSKYKIENNKLYLIYPDANLNQELTIKTLDENKLVLEQKILDIHTLSFEYKKMHEIKNLCPTK